MRRPLLILLLAAGVAVLINRWAMGQAIDWRLGTLSIMGAILALMADKHRYHRRMSGILGRVCRGDMSAGELFHLARRDPEVREGLVEWGKRDPEFLDALRREGLYP